MKYLKFTIIITTILFFSNCKKDAEVLSKAYPYISLDDILEVSTTGVGLKANIVNSNNIQINEFGFVLNSESKPTINDRKILVGIDDNPNQFQSKIENDLVKDEVYSVRAYVKTNQYTIYSNEKNFQSNGCMAPMIKQFSPNSVKPSGILIIVGDYFSESPSNNIVRLGSMNALVKSASKDTLKVQVPDVTLTKKVKITIEVADHITQSSSDLMLITPWSEIGNFVGDARYWSSYFTLASKGYVLLGYQGFNQYAPATVWEFNLENKSWKSLGDFSGGPRNRAISFEIDGYGYIGLGQSSNGNYLNDLWKYDSSSNNWIRLLDFPGYISGYLDYSYFILNGKLFITSFFDSNIWIFNPITNAWSSLMKDTSIKEKEIQLGFSINNTGYFIEEIRDFGEPNVLVIWQYNESNNTFLYTDSISIPSPLASHIATEIFTIANKLYMPLDNGKLLEYNFDNNATFYYSQLSKYSNYNFIFKLKDKVFLCNETYNGVSKRMFEFFPAR